MLYEGIDSYGNEWKPGDKERFYKIVWGHLDNLHLDAGINWFPYVDPIDGMVYGLVAYPDRNDPVYVGEKLAKSILDFECDYSYTMRDLDYDAVEYLFGSDIWDYNTGGSCFVDSWYEEMQAACHSYIMDYYKNLYKSDLDSDDPDKIESANLDLYLIRNQLGA